MQTSPIEYRISNVEYICVHNYTFFGCAVNCFEYCKLKVYIRSYLFIYLAITMEWTESATMAVAPIADYVNDFTFK